MKSILGFVLLGLILNGCATSSGGYSGSGLIGNNRNTNYNLSDVRLANKTIQYSEVIPDNATSMGEFTVRRCHRNINDPQPSESTLRNDLKLAAFAQGADGFSGFEIKTSGLTLANNCCKVFDATSTFYSLNDK